MSQFVTCPCWETIMATAFLLAAVCVLLAMRFNESAPDRLEVPIWADFFGPGQFLRFLDLVQDYFRNRHIQFTMLDGVVSLPSLGDGGKVGLGLTNIAQACHQMDETDWPALIGEHFDHIVLSLQETRSLKDKMGDFEQIRSRLLVQVWPEETLETVGPENIVHHVHLRDTASILAIDSPMSLMSVSVEHAKKWGQSTEELFRIGLQNVLEKHPPQVSPYELGETPIMLMTGQHICLPANVLLLRHYPGCLGRYGSLLGLPHREVILCHPIDDEKVLPALGMMLNALPKMYQEGPWSISPNLYWFHNGRFTNLPYESGNTVRFMPPPEFVDLLQEVAGPEMDAEEF